MSDIICFVCKLPLENSKFIKFHNQNLYAHEICYDYNILFKCGCGLILDINNKKNDLYSDIATHSCKEPKISDIATHSCKEPKISDIATHSCKEPDISDMTKWVCKGLPLLDISDICPECNVCVNCCKCEINKICQNCNINKLICCCNNSYDNGLHVILHQKIAK